MSEEATAEEATAEEATAEEATAEEATAEEAADEGAYEADACRDSVRFEGSESDSPSRRQPVDVVVGTSALASDAFCTEVAAMVSRAYGYGRIGAYEVRSRLAMGDGNCTNRVLHVATRAGMLVGCCSSTLQTPWCPAGCGHWGLLAVDPAAQGTGVASALVAAAEARLSDAGLREVQIEFDFSKGDPQSERLRAWYEGTCGFKGPGHSGSGFRRCRKRLPPPGSAPRSSSSSSSSMQQQQRKSGDSPSEKDALRPASADMGTPLIVRLWRALVRCPWRKQEHAKSV